MSTFHTVITAFLALVFVISGLLKASGNPKGFFATREVGVGDGVGRVLGTVEALAALGLIIGMKYPSLQWPPLLILWILSATFLYFFFRANKAKMAFPFFFLLTLTSIALATA